LSYLEEHNDEIFKKYSDEELLKDIFNFQNGDGKLNKVLNNYFKECMYKCCGKKTKISPYEVLQDDEKMKIILEYINSKPKFFTSDSEVSNVESCFRNSMSWVRKVANFPPKNAREIYGRYFPDYDKNKLNAEGYRINCLDTSAGFGSRMSAVLLTGNNYCAFDPNQELFEKLKEYYTFLKNHSVVSADQRCGLYCGGSEIYRPQLEGIFDVSFTSPPYFNLEKYYNDASSSTSNYNNYDLWVKYFVYPTVQNTYRYLKVNGYAMINIKDISAKQTCFKDFYKAFSSIPGFQPVEIFDMEISKKQYGMAHDNEIGVINNKEPIMSFKKVK
jgi:hypothetical protein